MTKKWSSEISAIVEIFLLRRLFQTTAPGETFAFVTAAFQITASDGTFTRYATVYAHEYTIINEFRGDRRQISAPRNTTQSRSWLMVIIESYQIQSPFKPNYERHHFS